MLVFGLSFVCWKELTPSLHWQLIECKLERERESEREEKERRERRREPSLMVHTL